MESEPNAEGVSFVGQIVAQALQGLAQHDAFDADALARLRALAKSGNLVKYELVVSVLSTEEEK